MNKNININKNINLNNKKLLFKGIIIWCLATVFYFLDNLLQVSPGAMKPELSVAFNLSAADLGILSSCYLWSYGLMQIPVGLLMDKIGPRKLFTFASFLCAVGSFLFAISVNFAANPLLIAQIGRVLIGTGAAFAFVGCSKIASIWFSAHKFAIFSGLLVAVGMSGSAVGLTTINYILQAINWQYFMYYSSCAYILLSILMWLIIRDHPTEGTKQNSNVTSEKSSEKSIDIIAGLKQIICSKQVWVASIYAGLMFVPTLAFGGLWGIPYLVEAHGLSRDLAGFLVSLIFVGWMFGGPIYGVISDYLCSRNMPMYFANIATLVISIILIYTANLSVITIGLLMFLLGLCSSGFILAFVVTKESYNNQLSGTAIGFINMVNTFSIAILQWIIGKILDIVAINPIITDLGEKLFSYRDYKIALLSIPICLIISLITVCTLKENKIQQN